MSEPTVGYGPYDYQVQARVDAAALTAAIEAVDPGFGPMTDAIRARRRQASVDYLTAALTGAGVELGQLDRRIAAWVADWEPYVVQVILGWVERSRVNQAAGAVHCLTMDAAVPPGLCGAISGPGSFQRRYVTCPDCLMLLAERDGGA